MHHVFIQARADNKHKWLKLPYVVNEEDILAIVKQWLVEWLKDTGTKPNIPIPPVTNVGAGPSHTQQNDPLEESEEQSESQQSEGDQGGDDGDEDKQEDLVKIVSDPNRPDKRKSPEAEEVTKPQSRKKAKASKGTNIIEELAVTIEELDQSDKIYRSTNQQVVTIYSYAS